LLVELNCEEGVTLAGGDSRREFGEKNGAMMELKDGRLSHYGCE